MSINQVDLEILVNVARNYVALVDATTITLGDGGQGGLGGRTRNQIAGLINRWDNATKAVGHGLTIADT